MVALNVGGLILPPACYTSTNKASSQDSKDPNKSYPAKHSLKTNILGLGMKPGLPGCWLKVEEMVIWLSTHDACDLAFHINSRSPHSVVGHHEQTMIPDCFLNYHAVAIGPGPAPLEWVLSLHAGGGCMYNDGGVLTNSAEHFK